MRDPKFLFAPVGTSGPFKYLIDQPQRYPRLYGRACIVWSIYRSIAWSQACVMGLMLRSDFLHPVIKRRIFRTHYIIIEQMNNDLVRANSNPLQQRRWTCLPRMLIPAVRQNERFDGSEPGARLCGLLWTVMVIWCINIAEWAKFWRSLSKEGLLHSIQCPASRTV